MLAYAHAVKGQKRHIFVSVSALTKTKWRIFFQNIKRFKFLFQPPSRLPKLALCRKKSQESKRSKSDTWALK
jgi:hypothetical protein